MNHAVPGGRSLIGMAECPFCDTTVYLGDAEPREQLQELRVDEQIDSVTMAMPRWWVCVHMGPRRHTQRWGWTDTPHRWKTAGPIEIRPVFSLHVDVLKRAR
jgi:hypothetical protein